MRKRTRIAVIAIVAALGFGAAGLAWAAFTGTDTATASGGSTGTLNPLTQGTVSYDYEGSMTALWPGHSAHVVIPVTNPNEVPVGITSVATGSKSGTCSAQVEQSAADWELRRTSDNVLVQEETSASPFAMPQGTGFTLIIKGGVALDAAAGNGCQSVTNLATTWNIGYTNL